MMMLIEICPMQAVKYFERILYAADEAEAKQSMLEAQAEYTSSNGHHRDPDY